MSSSQDVGGCTWSQLKNCQSGKDIIAAHRGKIGSVSLNSLKRNSVSVATGSGFPISGNSQQHLYQKRTANSSTSRTSLHPKDQPVEQIENPTTIPVIQDPPKKPKVYIPRESIMGIKLYSVSDSPPTLAVRMGLKYLGIEYELVDIDFGNGEQVTEEYTKKNPQGEVPLLDDNGFILSESVAILQYLADSYKKDETFYPTNPKERAIVNHRLAFHLSTFYRAVADYMLLPLCYAYPRTEENSKKLVHALKVFEDYFNRSGTSYVAGNNVTIADLPMIMGMVCLEAMGMDISPFPKIQTWYEDFKKNQTDCWNVGIQGLNELSEFEKNPPDLSHVNHPIHPTDKKKLK